MRPGRRGRRRARGGGRLPRCSGPGCAARVRVRTRRWPWPPTSPRPPRRAPGLGDLDVVEEDLGEAGLPVDLGDGAHGHAGRVHGDEEVGQPAVALGLGVGPEDAEAPLGERAPAGPGLLPVEHPAVARRVARGPASGCRRGRCRRRARTSPGTRSRHPRPWAAGSGPSGPRCRTRAWWGRGGRCRSGSPAWGPGPGSTPPRRPATRRCRRRGRRTRSGQLTTDQRSSYIVCSQARWASKPSAVSSEGRGSGRDVRLEPGPGLGPEGLLLGREGQVHGEGIWHSRRRVAKVRCSGRPLRHVVGGPDPRIPTAAEPARRCSARSRNGGPEALPLHPVWRQI